MVISIRRLAIAWIAGAALLYAPASKADPLLPLNQFASPQEFSAPDISPDGKNLVYVDRSSGKPMVVVWNLETRERKAILAGAANEFETSGCWFKNNTRLVCHFRGTELDMGRAFGVSRLIALNSDGKDLKVLVQNGRAGASQFQDQIIDRLRDDDRHVLIQLDDDRDVFTSVFTLDVYSGNLARIQRDRSPILQWRTDREGIVRFGYGYKNDNYVYITRDSESAPWRELSRFKGFNHQDFHVYGFGVLPDKLIVAAPKDGRNAVWEMDLSDKSDRELLFAQPKVDVDGPMHWPSDGRVVGFEFSTEKPELQLFDSQALSIQTAVDRALPGATNRVISASRDSQRIIVRSVRDVKPPNYYLLNVPAGKLSVLSDNAPLLTSERLSPMKPILVRTADGVDVPGYLTLPVGRATKNLPAVVLPHGGPYARDEWEFDPLVQMLASRGYAVLQVNYRGSTGYGDAWFQAGLQHWGTTMHEDITAGTRWLVAQGIADPQRVCIVGWSYGGYAALIGGIKQPDLYRCVVSIAGVSDMTELSWEYGNFYEGRQSVQDSTGTANLAANSPRRRALELKAPVLLVHGTWDSRVPIEHSKAMASALSHGGHPAKLVLIEHGDHSLSKPEMRLQLFQELEAFLAKHLPP